MRKILERVDIGDLQDDQPCLRFLRGCWFPGFLTVNLVGDAGGTTTAGPKNVLNVRNGIEGGRNRKGVHAAARGPSQ